MFASLGYKWGLTLFGILAVLMAPTPFVSWLLYLAGYVINVACGQVLFVYGSKIRAKSIASRNILAADSQSKHENREGV